MSALTVEKLTAVYVKIRDARRELSKKDDELKAQLDAVSQRLLEICTGNRIVNLGSSSF